MGEKINRSVEGGWLAEPCCNIWQPIFYESFWALGPGLELCGALRNAHPWNKSFLNILRGLPLPGPGSRTLQVLVGDWVPVWCSEAQTSFPSEGHCLPPHHPPPNTGIRLVSSLLASWSCSPKAGLLVHGKAAIDHFPEDNGLQFHMLMELSCVYFAPRACSVALWYVLNN